jgi:hypothetical protein
VKNFVGTEKFAVSMLSGPETKTAAGQVVITLFRWQPSSFELVRAACVSVPRYAWRRDPWACHLPRLHCEVPVARWSSILYVYGKHIRGLSWLPPLREALRLSRAAGRLHTGRSPTVPRQRGTHLHRLASW